MTKFCYWEREARKASKYWQNPLCQRARNYYEANVQKKKIHMKRHKTKETGPCSTHLNCLPVHENEHWRGQRYIYIHRRYTFICMPKTLTSVLDQAFGKRQFSLTVALALQHHSGFYVIIHGMLSNHNTARKKTTNQTTTQHLSRTEPILFLLIKVAYVFIHHQVRELLYMKAGLKFLFHPAQRVMRSEVILNQSPGKCCLIPWLFCCDSQIHCTWGDSCCLNTDACYRMSLRAL